VPLQILHANIVTHRADAIVNAANTALRGGGGVCGAIFSAAGWDDMQAACDKLGGCETGRAVATPAFRLPAKYVIHTPGPVWRGGTHGEEALLASCYRSSLALARKLGLQSVAFPLISGGIFGYPRDEALRVAEETIRDSLEKDGDLRVDLMLYP
jgi:O-acetyl-ADP-ribose deacetylase (regulator of RNase III)